LTEALSACSRELLEFIYETIARSRRRSLREMWLAVRESMANPNTELRSRILEYLTQGDITPTLERLLTAEHFAYKDWLELLEGVEPGADVNELRGASGRLLTSTPDHPGLLLSRACSEVLQANKNLAEFASNLEASLTSARLRYGVGAPAVASLAEWLIIFGEGQAPSVLTVVVAALRGLEGAEELVAGAEERALQSPDNVGLSILGFASALEATVQQVHGLQELMRG